ncbi:MAG: hypothetical protein AAF612_12745, partial [Planctomycetota bacterium]
MLPAALGVAPALAQAPGVFVDSGSTADEPIDLTVAIDGSVWVATQTGGTVEAFDPALASLGVHTAPAGTTYNAIDASPSGVIAAGSNQATIDTFELTIGSQRDNTRGYFTGLTTFQATAGSTPVLTFASDGALWSLNAGASGEPTLFRESSAIDSV